MKWPTEDVFAVTVDGKILMNARALDGVDLAELAKKRPGVFVGVLLQVRESRLLSEHLYDAYSEAAARIGGSRRKRTGKRSR